VGQSIGVEAESPQFYAFRALRFILAGYRRDKKHVLRENQSGESKNLARRNPGGWT
jgi:hypothetical protein